MDLNPGLLENKCWGMVKNKSDKYVEKRINPAGL